MKPRTTYIVNLGVCVSHKWIDEGFDLTNIERKQQLIEAVKNLLPMAYDSEVNVQVEVIQLPEGTRRLPKISELENDEKLLELISDCLNEHPDKSLRNLRGITEIREAAKDCLGLLQRYLMGQKANPNHPQPLKLQFEKAGFKILGQFANEGTFVQFFTNSADVKDSVETTEGTYTLKSSVDVTSDKERSSGLDYRKVKYTKAEQ